MESSEFSDIPVLMWSSISIDSWFASTDTFPEEGKLISVFVDASETFVFMRNFTFSVV